MDSHLVAKILIPCDEGDYFIGTAFPIRENLIITARHVIYDGDVLKNSLSEIKAVWPSIKDECIEAEVKKNKAYSSVAEEIVFDGGKDYDIVLLRCLTPKVANQALPSVPFRDPRAHETWVGWGFPEIGKNDETRISELISVLGKFHPPKSESHLPRSESHLLKSESHLLKSDSHQLTLSCEGDSLEKEGWCGLSGAPVLNGRVAYALITEAPKNRAGTFNAISIHHLIRSNPEFAAHLGIYLDKADFSQVREYLSAHVDLRRELTQRIRVCPGTEVDSVGAIISRLSRIPVSEFLEQVYQLQQGGLIPLSVIQKFVCLMLPTLYSSCMSNVNDVLLSGKGKPTAGIIEIPFATDVSAELLMANVDRRPADFRVIPISSRIDTGYQARPGRYHIDMPPNSGPEEVERSLEDMTLDLNHKLSLNGCVESLKGSMDDSLFNNLVRKQMGGYTREQKLRKVRSLLEREAGRKLPGYYWLVPLRACESEEGQQRLRALAETIKLDYPMITLMCLDSSFEQEEWEDAELELLHEMLRPSKS